MKFLLAPDSFKECMTAKEAALVMKEAVHRVFPDADTLLLPVADGGEGTLDVLTYATGGTMVETRVTGPLGDPVPARYSILGDGRTAVVEMAQASGLQLVPPARRNPLLTTSYGTGELIKAALDHCIEKLIVTIGGSATNDGGAGMLQALGAKLYDANHKPVAFGGGSLGEVSRIDLSSLDPRLRQITIQIACDVSNPLVGPRGASHVFGPQKGATPEMVSQLEANLTHFADIVRKQTGVSLHHVPGAGAAGGLGAALLLCGGQLVPGIDLVLDVLSFEDKLTGADYVLTGEGKIDDQTPDGKVIAGIVKRARKANVPVIAFAGSVLPGYERLYEQGLLSVHSIISKPCTLDEALARGAENLLRTVENTIRLLHVKSEESGACKS
ncbi:glycerate kinase [Lihuaxuella thermophila]|uniref:Glycerate kinase n=1 Tax=Lihuaxuella thermophila TaxID=1173111 RepID=A0A1H8AI94_9BACL|nr:glycerate kinase [Lihuaxuella thermophila]SEM70440.1 glycerate kinase [Lihuaxuella thermophila]